MARESLLNTPDMVTRSASDFYDQHFVDMMNFSVSRMVFDSHKSLLESVGRVLSTDERSPREVFPNISNASTASEDTLNTPSQRA